jgi:DmsE family decaheme c-type cytochrome
VQITGCAKNRVRFVSIGVVLLGVIALGMASCKGPDGRSRFWFRKSEVGWPKGVARWQEAKYPVLKVDLPQVVGAELINDDSLCATCHETYVKKFETNVHRAQKCEGCHGPGSRHVETRGQEPGLILSFNTLPAAQRSELCLKCHEKPSELAHPQWRTSAHANSGVACTDCHRGHYNVPPGTPATELAGSSRPQVQDQPQVAVSASDESGSLDLVGFLLAPSRNHRPVVCGTSRNSPTATSLLLSRSKAVDTLSGAETNVRAQEPSQAESLRGTSNYMGAIAPQVCYKCHSQMRELEEIAHPHQVCGRNGFNCTTCHDAHGKIRMETRKETCLECHKGAPTMAWHSSTHNLHDVACTDCHNPHPRAKVEEFVNVNHTSIDRPKRMPMSVDEPDACFKCHPKIFAMTSMPSHHPIKEGKMTCSDCHDGHGQNHGNLKDGATVNMVCNKCHAEKQGPFAYEHPPVTESCVICHEPHGTVANNLLRQPANFLCLRCHTGHRTSPLGPNHAPLLGDVGTSKPLQRAFYTDCTQCHKEIHGSDLPSPHVPHGFMR